MKRKPLHTRVHACEDHTRLKTFEYGSQFQMVFGATLNIGLPNTSCSVCKRRYFDQWITDAATLHFNDAGYADLSLQEFLEKMCPKK